MKRILIFLCAMLLLCGLVCAQEQSKLPDLQTADRSFFDPTANKKVVEQYHFGVEYRLEAGYVQNNQRSDNLSYPINYLHGVRVGATFTFLLPRHFSLQTGVLYSLAYGNNEQHWRSMTAQSVQTEYIQHRVLQHQLIIPVRCFYTIPLWKQLNLFFYGGAQYQLGLAETDYMQLHLSEGAQQWLSTQGVRMEKYDKLTTNELWRSNIQLGVGGGLEWDRYRLQAGYDFGLNNRVKTPAIQGQLMKEWSWYVSFSYRF